MPPRPVPHTLSPLSARKGCHDVNILVRVAILFVVMVYRASSLRGLAVAQMVFGALMIVFGIASIIAVDRWSSHIGFGIWIGGWVSASCTARALRAIKLCTAASLFSCFGY